MRDRSRRVDWEALRAQTLESDNSPEEARERMEAIFRARALELAARRDSSRDESNTLPVLAFTLGDERYGLALTDLAGVLAFGGCTAVPGGPGELLGVINHQGEICSVLDLARVLGVPANPVAESAYVLLLRRPVSGGGGEVGFKVDSVEGLVAIEPDVAVSPGEEAGPVAPYLRGVTTDRRLLLSAEALLSHPLFMKAPQE